MNTIEDFLQINESARLSYRGKWMVWDENYGWQVWERAYRKKTSTYMEFGKDLKRALEYLNGEDE